MKKVNFYIDGFNIYHAINNMSDNKLKWLDYSLLCGELLKYNEKINKIYYFSALYKNKEKKNRHNIFIKALKSKNIKVVLGNFKKRTKKWRIDKKYLGKYNINKNLYLSITNFEEKESDVNLAIYLVRDAINNDMDKAIVFSGDSDFIPAVKMAKSENTSLKIGVVMPKNTKANKLTEVYDFYEKLSKFNLYNCTFPNEILLNNGSKITCPKEWQ